MSTSVGLQKSVNVREPPRSIALDEAAWEAWVEKGRAREKRNSAARLTAVKWVSLAALVVVAGLWSDLAPYDVVARFIVTAGATFVMFHSIHSEHYAMAAVFAAVALLYNPVAPVFSFSGDWPRAVVLASVVPFVASLTARSGMGEQNA
jgi:hypothetical protein